MGLLLAIHHLKKCQSHSCLSPFESLKQNAQLHFILLHVMRAPVKITHFPIFLILPKLSPLQRQKQSRAHAFYYLYSNICFQYLRKKKKKKKKKEKERKKAFMNILVRNTGNQILKLSKFTYFQISKLYPLKNINAPSIE